ncbi:hypothetical protein PLICRDRAFT_175681 [Plicaturopsis crispa FD-325 SS-3]|nr:hypothetical protein PLICRDRAFT_175681 [Plicaturopsis crispa FD-325 SS-3]
MSNPSVNVAELRLTYLIRGLTKAQVLAAVPPGTFSPGEMTNWRRLWAAILVRPLPIKQMLYAAVVAKAEAARAKRKRGAGNQGSRRVARRVEEPAPEDGNGVVPAAATGPVEELRSGKLTLVAEEPVDTANFMQLPSIDEKKECYRHFRDATSNAVLAMVVCIVCGREMMRTECEDRIISEIPSISTLFAPHEPHSLHSLHDGALLSTEHVVGDGLAAHG